MILGVLCGVCLFHAGRHKQFNDIKEALLPSLFLCSGFLAVFLPWAIYAYNTFGFFLPNTLDAKIAQLQTGIWKSFSYRLFNIWIWDWGRSFFLFHPLFNLWWILVILGTAFVCLIKRKFLILFLWIVLYVSGYTFLKVAGYPWYQVPVHFVLQIFAAMGIIACFHAVSKLKKNYKTTGYTLCCIITTFIIVMSGKTTIAGLRNYPQPDYWQAECYPRLCEWINENTEKSESIAYIEIGYLGYSTNNRIIDLAGLIHPEMVPHIAKRDFAWGFWHFMPDYYVYVPFFGWALHSLNTDPEFEQLYKPVATISGCPDLVIFKRSND